MVVCKDSLGFKGLKIISFMLGFKEFSLKRYSGFLFLEFSKGKQKTYLYEHFDENSSEGYSAIHLKAEDYNFSVKTSVLFDKLYNDVLAKLLGKTVWFFSNDYVFDKNSYDIPKPNKSFKVPDSLEELVFDSSFFMF